MHVFYELKNKSKFADRTIDKNVKKKLLETKVFEKY